MNNVIDVLIEKIRNKEINEKELIRYLKIVSWRIEGLEDTFKRLKENTMQEYKKNKEISDFAQGLAYNTAEQCTKNYFVKSEIEKGDYDEK